LISEIYRQIVPCRDVEGKKFTSGSVDELLTRPAIQSNDIARDPEPPARPIGIVEFGLLALLRPHQAGETQSSQRQTLKAA
jgi:hypothetical protein